MMPALLLAAQLTLAPEQSIPWNHSEPRAGDPRGGDVLPRIATDGNGFLAVWQFGMDQSLLHRFDAEGRAIGTDATLGELRPLEITPIGSGYLVLARTFFDEPQLMRFDTKGVVMGQPTPPLFNDNSSNGAIAWNGTRALVVSNRGSAVLTDASGRIVVDAIRYLPADSRARVQVASAGTGFVILHDSAEGFFARAVSAEGVIQPPVLIDAEAAGAPPMEIVSLGDGYVILWSVNGVLRARRLDLAGQALGTVRELGRFGAIRHIAAAWTGSDVAVIFSAGDLHAMRLGPDLAPLAPPSVVAQQADGEARELDLAASGHRMLAFWRTRALCAAWGYSKLTAKRIDDPAAEEILVTPGAPVQGDPAVAFANGVTATAYVQLRDNSRIRIYLLPSGKEVALPETGEQQAPTIATNGSSFVLTWVERRPPDCQLSMFVAAIAPDGRLLAPPTRLGSTGHQENYSAIVWTGADYALFWESHDFRLLGRRVRADGTPIDPEPLPLGPPELGQVPSSNGVFAPNATWTGSEIVVAWSVMARGETVARRLTRELLPIGDRFRLLDDVGGMYGWNGRSGIVAWGASRLHALAATVSADWKVGPTRELGEFFNTYRFEVIADGDRFLIPQQNHVLVVGPDAKLIEAKHVSHEVQFSYLAIGYAPSGVAVAYETPRGVRIRPGTDVRGRAIR